MRNLEKAHLVSRRIEENIKREVSHVDHILIHYEPTRKETQVCTIPLEVDKKTVSLHFGDAPVFYLATIKADNRTILEEKFLKNPYIDEEKGKGIKVSEWLIQQGTDSVFIRKEFRGKGPSYVFSDGGVDVHLTASGVLEDAQKEMEITAWCG